MRDSSDAARKKENSPSLCQPLPLLASFPHSSFIPLLPSPFIATSRRLEMEMVGTHWSFRWKSLAFRGVFRGMVKRTAIYEELTPTGSRLPEVICRDMVINANRKIAGTIGRGLG